MARLTSASLPGVASARTCPAFDVGRHGGDGVEHRPGPFPAHHRCCHDRCMRYGTCTMSAPAHRLEQLAGRADRGAGARRRVVELAPAAPWPARQNSLMSSTGPEDGPPPRDRNSRSARPARSRASARTACAGRATRSSCGCSTWRAAYSRPAPHAPAALVPMIEPALGLVLDHERLLELLRQMPRELAGIDVGWPTGRRTAR